MTKFEAASLIMSTAALSVSIIAAYYQYKTRQDAVEEKLRIEVKATLDNAILNPTELRMISGVEERKRIRSAILITNTGSTTVRLVEVGYQDYDLPKYAFNAVPSKAKILAPGEQALFNINGILKIEKQLTKGIRLGDDMNASVFAVTTKQRFQEEAFVDVAE